MRVTNDLLAAYVERRVSREERKAVRRYLVEHPWEMLTVVGIMDEEVSRELSTHGACCL